MDTVGRYKSAPEACFLAALAAASIALMGWVLDSPALRGFGIPEYPDWPLAAIANLLLALALLSLGRAPARTRHLLLALPAAIACGTVIEYLARRSLGIDHLLFPHELADFALPSPGRPGVMATLLILTMTCVVWRADEETRRASEALLACAVFGLAAMSMTLLALGSGLVAHQPTRIAASLPAAAASALQALGFLFWLGRKRADFPWTGGSEMRLARFGLAGVIVLPATLLPIEIRLSQLTPLTPVTTEILASAFNLLIVVGLLGWAVERIAREQRRLEQISQALRESEEQLMLAIEAHDISLFTWDIPTGRIIPSPGADERLGVPAESLKSFHAWRKLVDDEDLAAIQQTVAEVSRNKGDNFSFRYHLRRPGGEIRTIEGSARCFYDAAGQLTRAVGVSIDVTEPERREAALLAGRAQLQSILETVPDAMIVLGETGTIRSLSATAVQLFRYQPDRITGKNISLLLPAWEGRSPADFLTSRSAYDKRSPENGRTLMARRSNGTELPVEPSVGEAWINGRRIFTVFVRDISERVAAEARLEQLNAEFAHGARLSAMGEMASTLAHELNQPLAAASNFLGAIEQSLPAGEANARLLSAVEQAQVQLLRAGDIIRRLRDFIRNREVERQVEDLGQIIEDACALTFVGHPEVTVTRQIADEARSIIGDRVQIQQVFVNALRNAAQVMRTQPETPPRIEIGVSCNEGEACVRIADNGPGFPRKILTRPYQSFFTSGHGEGMGVGISISRRIIEAHGGQYTLSNGPTGGAVVRFTIPLFVPPQEDEL